MSSQSLSWNTADGLELSGRVWEPLAPPRAVLCLVHGLGEHIGRYQHVGQKMTDVGLALMGFDLRGHGRSQGQRGHSSSYDHLMADIDELLRQAEGRFPKVPQFLYGHSLGGNLVLCYLLSRRPQISGAVVTAPFLAAAFEPPAWKLILGQLLYNLVPSFVMSNSLDPQGLSRDPAVAQAYTSDPLVHDRVSARLGLDMINHGKRLTEQADQLTVPLLLMNGSDDPIVSPQACQAFAACAPADTAYHQWSGLLHELHNETEQDEVLQTIIAWVGDRLAT